MSGVTFDFRGSVALVTGAARGIGREIALRFVRAGAKVVAADRDGEGLAETEELAGEGLVVHAADIGDESEVDRLLGEVDARFGRLDICVNDAAVAPRQGLLEHGASLWDRVFEVNCRGTFLVTRAAARVMILRNVAGRIVNFSSTAATKGGQGAAAYASSRAAVEAFGRVVAVELAPHGILVNTVRPGLVDTQPRPLPPSMDAALGARIPTLPLRRPGLPGEVAEVVLFLASPASSYMTGSVVVVDGGASVGAYSAGPVVDEDPRYRWLYEAGHHGSDGSGRIGD